MQDDRKQEATLVLGASGATGHLLVRQLLESKKPVRAIVRDQKTFEARVFDGQPKSSLLEVIERSVLDLSKTEMVQAVTGCDSVASTLGHELNFGGLFSSGTAFLCRDALKNVCDAITETKPTKKVAVILMNSAGCHNNDLKEAEQIGSGHGFVLGLLRNLMTPHYDNEQANEHLRSQIGQTHAFINWVVVRPDSLIDSQETSAVSAFPSPLSNPISNPGQTARINVASFMARLVVSATGPSAESTARPSLVEAWQGKMPVLYDSDKLPAGVVASSP